MSKRRPDDDDDEAEAPEKDREPLPITVEVLERARGFKRKPADPSRVVGAKRIKAFF